MDTHYIPRFYLKGFEYPNKRNFIWAFRRGSDPFLTSIRKIAQEENFYSKEIEQLLANEVENPANQVINKIREQKNITQEEKYLLSTYMLVMWKRVPEGKKRIKDKAPEIMNPVFERTKRELTELKELYPHKREIIEKRLRELHELQVNKADEILYEIWLNNIPPNRTPQSVEILSQMTWRFMIPDKAQYNITSDNPLFFFSWMGIGKEESEVTFPITKNIALWATWRIDLNEGYFQSSNQFVKEVNRRTASNYTQFIYTPHCEVWIKLLVNKPKDRIKLNRIV